MKMKMAPSTVYSIRIQCNTGMQYIAVYWSQLIQSTTLQSVHEHTPGVNPSAGALEVNPKEKLPKRLIIF